MYYSSFGLLSFVVLIIINIDFLNKSDSSLVRQRYRSFILSVLFFLASDILWGTLYDLRVAPFAYIDTVLFFFSMVLSVLLWTRFVVKYLDEKGGFTKVLNIAGWIIFAYESVCLIINFFKPMVFYFDAAGEYYPMQARYITLAMQTLLFFISSVYTLSFSLSSKGKASLHHRAVGISGMTMTVFIILQTLYPLLPFYAIGCLLATCIIHTFVVLDERADYYRELGTANYKALTDPLTGVKNNNAYMDAKKNIDLRIAEKSIKKFAIIIFDVNDLKLVNDTMGHGEGDKYIMTAASSICGCLSTARYSG